MLIKENMHFNQCDFLLYFNVLYSVMHTSKLLINMRLIWHMFENNSIANELKHKINRRAEMLFLLFMLISQFACDEENKFNRRSNA